ncbi:hypothetical protein GCM10014715_23790 [Streptomyces spiralis]|uniref:Mutator family transposase n=1 Tax=Streptomyces spiralis TaxID=66376 RepID=A0A919DRM3_9ACTN|nr:hypothetical protein GCM10014715_23790 [Streptomyces spiralis]
MFPDTHEQRCWVHKTADVLDSMPKSAQPGTKKAVQDIYYAEDRDHAARPIKTFEKLYGAKLPKAVKKGRERAPLRRPRPRRSPLRGRPPCRTPRDPRGLIEAARSGPAARRGTTPRGMAARCRRARLA